MHPTQATKNHVVVDLESTGPRFENLGIYIKKENFIFNLRLVSLFTYEFL